MRISLLLLLFLLIGTSCKQESTSEDTPALVRGQNAHGFARHSWQMDSLFTRIGVNQLENDLRWKAAISPHDDYSYAGPLYYEALRGINAPNIILIGVAHRARNFGLQDKIVFGNYTHWETPYGQIQVSPANREIMKKLSEDNFIVHDSMQLIEHSLEAIVPWIHRKNPGANIIPILVPYINYEGIDSISGKLAEAVNQVMENKQWEFGKDVAIVISNDAVHYGDLEWGDSKNMAPFGTDSLGTASARERDMEIIDKCLTGELSNKKIKTFTEYTVQPENYKEYKWVWCGRYSVPFGLAFANRLNELQYGESLQGDFLGYQSSIDHELIEVEDLGMETTAIANNRHWVAYTAIKYE
ncbi:AmmeMemoRadiSam system protein B [Zeaxanthinibacter sp. PT1]|uniref:AmmeMemoRadiSam system protein B n=1 Tax=Zeaxanthinibacter TaxID=561554 RepID=UPI002349432D|nr:AmmeMemoRadiSam system protein B [Zeaxanthinibacter sp. PT1]MDC6350965.1 AmmeMemoRadiSam system protein B [Zeaxanthinibacter sp. PT1]